MCANDHHHGHRGVRGNRCDRWWPGNDTTVVSSHHSSCASLSACSKSSFGVNPSAHLGVPRQSLITTRECSPHPVITTRGGVLTRRLSPVVARRVLVTVLNVKCHPHHSRFAYRLSQLNTLESDYQLCLWACLCVCQDPASVPN